MLELLERNSIGRTTTFNEKTRYVSYTVPWPPFALIDFLRYGTNSPRFFWESEKATATFAGFGVAAILTAHGHNRFQSIQQQASRLFSRLTPVNTDIPLEVGPRLFGGFAFNADHPSTGLWTAFPPARFILPQYQLSRINGQSWLTVNHVVSSEAERRETVRLLPLEIHELRTGLRAGCPQTRPALRPPVSTNVMAQETWQRLVAEATHRIRQNELDKVVLARARHLQFDRPIDPADALMRLADRYPDTYRFLFEPVPGHAFFGATPELLAEVEGSTLRTVAMAGSIKRGRTPAEDAWLGQQLLDNPKERSEHALVVEAIEEWLTPLAAGLHVPATPTVCTLSNIQHLQTKIQGRLSGSPGIVPVVQALHPTPAVGGRPRAIALDIINNVEPTPRGWYAAPIGWIDERGNGMFAVAIRSAVSVGDESMLFAGAGIVADSVPEKEWRETELKFKPLAEALGGEATNERA